MRLKFLYFILSFLAMSQIKAQVIFINPISATYTQNFDTLAGSGTANTIMPKGWLFIESGTGANTTYAADIGTANTGNTYSYGATSASDRAFGSLVSGSVKPTIGAKFFNNTGTSIGSVTISYHMEQWRLGIVRTTPDSMLFAYGINNGSLSAGTWNIVPQLHASGKIISGTVGALNGNDTANQRNYSYTLTGLTINPGDTLYIRWVDYDATSSDDGLAIDDFSLIASASSLVQPVTAINFSNITTSSAKLNWSKPAGYIDSTMTTLVFIKQGSAITNGTPTFSSSYYTSNSNFTGNGTTYQNDLLAKCVMNSDSNNVTITGLSSGINYYALVYTVRNTDTVYSTGVTANFTSKLFPPTGVYSVTITASGQTAATINWTQDTSYKKTGFTTLVYLKAGSVITAGTPTTSVTGINSNPFFMSGSKYFFDSSAYCVFNSDTTFVNVTGLSAGVSYYAMVFVVRDADSSYSTPATGSGTTVGPAPTPVTSVAFAAGTSTSAGISWTKPLLYSDPTLTTIVFIKKSASVNSGTPTSSINNYSASIIFGAGSAYQNDALAYCVYKGDSNAVTVNNLSASTTYQILIYVVRDMDSTYSSTGTTGSGTTLATPLFYNIGQINSTNMITGNPDSINMRVGLRGIVYGFNQKQGTGIQFVLRDNTGGITVSNNDAFGYTVNEGDSVMVEGTIASIRGLNIVANLDTLKLIASGKTLKSPVIISNLNELTENDLVRINRVKLLTTTDTIWVANAGYKALTQNNDTIKITILPGSSLAGKPLIVTPQFNITGTGSQMSTNTVAPFSFNGYFILPRSVQDIIPIEIFTKFNLITPLNNSLITAQNNPSTLHTFYWKKSLFTIGFDSVKYLFQFDTITGNFSNPKISSISGYNGTDTSFSISNTTIASLVNAKFTPYYGKWRVIASALSVQPLVQNSDSIFNISFTVGAFTKVEDISENTQLIIFPNPSNGKFVIRYDRTIDNIIITDITGRQLLNEEHHQANFDVDVAGLNKGIYFIRLTTSGHQLVKRLVIQ